MFANNLYTVLYNVELVQMTYKILLEAVQCSFLAYFNAYRRFFCLLLCGRSLKQRLLYKTEN